MSNRIQPWPLRKQGSHDDPVPALQYLLRTRGQPLTVDGQWAGDLAGPGQRHARGLSGRREARPDRVAGRCVAGARSGARSGA